MMDDKLIMTNLLDSCKSICTLLNHGSIESNDDVLCNTYKKMLTTCLTMQHDIYKVMQEEGWYPVENVKEQEICKVKSKFCTENCNCEAPNA